VREQVITPRAGRDAGTQAKGRGAAAAPSAQRPASKGARAKGKGRAGSVRRFAPLAARVLLAVCAGLLVFAAYRAAASASFFQLKRVEVEGTSRASRDDIKAAVERAAAGSGVWDANLDAMSERLRELPWVRAAYVQRVLPSGLRVRIVEREPRMIARTSNDRLVWVDDEGVSLGPAAVSGSDFIISGLEEASTPQARERNLQRVAAALEMKTEWEKSGVGERVSVVHLQELHDVWVELAGDDAGVTVTLGGKDYAERFRQALRVLDERRGAEPGTLIRTVNMSTGRNAIVGRDPDARVPVARAQDAGDETTPASPPKKETRKGAKGADARAPKAAERKPSEKKEAAKPAPALRERRVG
jgi:cell division septal protein FtsQ